ncbi:MAG: hypothetical protein KA175_00405 [Flavobacteriales bacterium]|nr:hypothetical protein [Flavobacteriales bacterium]MBP6696045.1 hypothetical protein [Flavobacteriales bacterium]
MDTKKDKTDNEALKKDQPSRPVPAKKKKAVVYRMGALSESEANIGPAQRAIHKGTIDEEPGRAGTDTPSKPSDRE